MVEWPRQPTNEYAPPLTFSAKQITKQGEYIAPEKLENVHTQSPLVAQSYVHGDSLQSYLVAVIVPDAEAVWTWAKANGEGWEF